MYNTNNHICFIESLKFNYSTVIFVIRAIYFKLFDQQNIYIIYFIDASEKTESVFTFLLSKLSIELERLSFDYLKIKDKNSILIGLKVVYTELLIIQKDIYKCSFFRKLIDEKKITIEEKLFLQKKVLEDDIFGSEIMRALYLIHVGLWQQRNTEKCDVVFFMK